MALARLLNESEIDIAVEILRAGGVVAVRTETVWGLCANLENGNKLYAAKRRPADKSLVMQFADLDSAKAYFKKDLGAGEEQLFKTYGGKITVVLKNNIAVRIPEDPIIKSILEKIQPLYVTSANISGEADAKKWEIVLKTLGGVIDAIVKSPEILCGIPSTIVKIEAQGVKIIRQGAAEIKG